MLLTPLLKYAQYIHQESLEFKYMYYACACCIVFRAQAYYTWLLIQNLYSLLCIPLHRSTWRCCPMFIGTAEPSVPDRHSLQEG